MRGGHWIKSTKDRWQSWYDTASDRSLKLVRLFIETSKIFTLIFLFDQSLLKTQQRLQNNYSSGDPVPLMLVINKEHWQQDVTSLRSL
jgi:hypothetical protein